MFSPQCITARGSEKNNRRSTTDGQQQTVVLSTRYGGGKGIFFQASVMFEQVLTELGCKAYNPNSKLKQEGCSDAEANDIWLRRFMQEILGGASSKGFVLQIAQGENRSKSNMQFAEEDIARLSKQPVLGVYITTPAAERGEYGISQARMEAWCAIEMAQRQWNKGVLETVEDVGIYSRSLPNRLYPGYEA